MANYLLIHGSYQGGWIWKPTVETLRESGHHVYAPTLDGCAERAVGIHPGITVTTQANEIANLLFYEDLDDVILVGTSTGGLVICKVACLARARIRRLVFVDALAPQPGERVEDIVVRDLNTSLVKTDLARGPSKADMEDRLFKDLQPALKSWAVERVTMHPTSASDAPGELDGFWNQCWAATVIRCKFSSNPSEAHQRRTAATLNANWFELDSGHYPMLSHPGELTRLLQA